MKRLKSVLLIMVVSLILTACGQSSQETISMEKAVEIALAEYNLTEDQVDIIKKEHDQTDSEYEIEFIHDGKEYDITVSSKGKVLEKDVDFKILPKPEAETTIDLEKALEIALKDQNLSEDQVTIVKKEEDLDDGDFEIEFVFDGKEYEYEIDKSGRIKDLDIDRAEIKAEGEIISMDQAKGIALKDAGLSESEVFDLEIELDRERGKDIYEISFDHGNKEYEYELDAISGEILKKEIEND